MLSVYDLVNFMLILIVQLLTMLLFYLFIVLSPCADLVELSDFSLPRSFDQLCSFILTMFFYVHIIDHVFDGK